LLFLPKGWRIWIHSPCETVGHGSFDHAIWDSFTKCLRDKW
jgi:hypothetical protein